MTSTSEIMIISSDREARRELAHILDSQGLGPICVSNIKEALALLGQRTMPLIFCDRHLPDGNYRDFLAALGSLRAKARVVVTSHLADWDEYLEAMRLGAFDVIAAPCRRTDVEWTLIQASQDERERTRATAASPSM